MTGVKFLLLVSSIKCCCFTIMKYRMSCGLSLWRAFIEAKNTSRTDNNKHAHQCCGAKYLTMEGYIRFKITLIKELFVNIKYSNVELKQHKTTFIQTNFLALAITTVNSLFYICVQECVHTLAYLICFWNASIWKPVRLNILEVVASCYENPHLHKLSVRGCR